MSTPAWILDIFAALMLVVAAVSAARLAVLRPWRLGRAAVVADIDVSHLLMAIAMAGMLAAGLSTLPNDAWEVVFGVLTLWFAYQVTRDVRREDLRALAAGHCTPHLVHAGAMLYMFLALTAPAASGGPGMGGMGGMGGSGMQTLGLPLLAFLFALALIGYSVWDLDQLSGPGAGPHYSLAIPRLAPAAVLVGVPAGAEAVQGAEPSVTQAAAPAPGGGVTMVAQPSVAGQAVSCAAIPVSLAGTSPLLVPWVATGCRIAMGVTMALMLMIMI
ncbi:MAG: DUF5134 domain-containing protein [Streptosporangiaceae bacterium]